MKHKIRPLTAQERRYTYAQSQQVIMQSGCIGYLRGDMGTDGNEFYTTWNDQIKGLRGDTFGGEFDEIVNALRFASQILQAFLKTLLAANTVSE